MNNESTLLLEHNLQQVWNQRDPAVRMQAIQQLYTPDANLYHVGSKVSGFEAINLSVTRVLESLPPDFEFTLVKPVIVNNDLCRAIWGAGPKGQAPVASGMDIACLESGKIKSLYVFLES